MYFNCIRLQGYGHYPPLLSLQTHFIFMNVLENDPDGPAMEAPVVEKKSIVVTSWKQLEKG